MNAEPRRLQVVSEYRPLLVVWETTLRCDQHCRFCGTRAGKKHPDELTTDEAMGIVDQLHEMGTAEIAVHGGEAYLRDDFLPLVKAIRARGMECTMVTGGRGFTPELADGLKAADITAVSVSVDGLEATHDDLRGLKGSHRSALRAMELLRERGVAVGSNTQVNRKNYRELEGILDLVADRGAYGWQVQLMVPMGRAAEAEDLWLQPYDILEVMPRIAAARQRADQRGVKLWPGNNVGYFGPYEHLLRSDRTRYGFSSGCGGGIRTMGIEANGDIKGCSAMASQGFVGGNVRDKRIREIWDSSPELSITRKFQLDDLWGYCRGCYYADTCKGGCVWTSSTLLGKIGNNPYCHHRALEMLREGQRERLTLVSRASGAIRDTARFELSVEAAPADWKSALPAQA
ncbi:MAG: radical SAM protein [Myxococcales bacterium]|nr:radical SAM protein [Myxococcales bacterium]